MQNCPHAGPGGLAFCAPVSVSPWLSATLRGRGGSLSGGVLWSAKGKPQRWGTAWSQEQQKPQLPYPLRGSARDLSTSITSVEAADEFSSSPAPRACILTPLKDLAECLSSIKPWSPQCRRVISLFALPETLHLHLFCGTFHLMGVVSLAGVWSYLSHLLACQPPRARNHGSSSSVLRWPQHGGWHMGFTTNACKTSVQRMLLLPKLGKNFSCKSIFSGLTARCSWFIIRP